jgi:hypothetical protein
MPFELFICILFNSAVGLVYYKTFSLLDFIVFGVIIKVEYFVVTGLYYILGVSAALGLYND